MYWTRFPSRSELEGGRTLVHGNTRLNLEPADVAVFVEPDDAAVVFGLRALEPEDGIDASFPVWMATLRRRAGNDAIVERLQRVFTQLADEGSLVQLVVDTARHARGLGYERLWLAPHLFEEPLLAAALRGVTQLLGTPAEVVATSGMVSLALTPSRGT